MLELDLDIVYGIRNITDKILKNEAFNDADMISIKYLNKIFTKEIEDFKEWKRNKVKQEN